MRESFGVSGELSCVSRELSCVSRDLSCVSRDLSCVSRDLFRVSRDLFRVSNDPLAIDAVIASVARPSCGAVATFVLWNQELQVDVLKKRLGLEEPTVRIFSNDPRLKDLTAFSSDGAMAS